MQRSFFIIFPYRSCCSQSQRLTVSVEIEIYTPVNYFPVICDICRNIQLCQRRHFHILAGKSHLYLRRLISINVKVYIFCIQTLSAFVVFNLQYILGRLLHFLRQCHYRSIIRWKKFDHRVLAFKNSFFHCFIKLKAKLSFSAERNVYTADIFQLFGFFLQVFRIIQNDIHTFQTGIFKNCNLKQLRLYFPSMKVKYQTIFKIFFNAGYSRSKKRVPQAFFHRLRTAVFTDPAYKFHICRNKLIKPAGN